MMNETKEMSRVSEAIVRAEKKPAFTESWHPFSHAEILDAMKVACDDLKLEVVAKEYSIRPDSKMLALWELGLDHSKDARAGVAILNSIDKTHSVTLGAFERVLVCSNLTFRLQFESVLFRKHSGALEIPEIVFLAREAITRLIPSFNRLREWHDEMKQTELSISQFSLLAIAGAKRGIIPTTFIPQFFDLYNSDKYVPYGRTLWTFHASATELMNENNALVIAWKQDRLNYWIDQEVPLLLKDAKKPMIDLKAIEGKAFKVYKDKRTKMKEDRKQIGAEIKEAYKEKVAEEKKADKEKQEIAEIKEKRGKRSSKKDAQGASGSTISKESDQSVASGKRTKPERRPKTVQRKESAKEIRAEEIRTKMIERERKSLLTPALDQKEFRKLKKTIAKRMKEQEKKGITPKAMIIERRREDEII